MMEVMASIGSAIEIRIVPAEGGVVAGGIERR
jgi:hypothetical protein